jgi:hypothetical protein
MRVLSWTALLLLALQVAAAQSTWLTDEQARDAAGAAIHVEYPEPCYSTYRKERLESWLLSVRKFPIVNKHLNNSVYFYRVADDVCDYVSEKDGKEELSTQATMDCCDYGLVAVDRATTKSYWFSGKKNAADVFKEFVQDEQLRPDFPNPTMFTSLYLDLVWGEYSDKEIRSLGQLQDLVQSNFKSAYSPYQRDTTWQRKFDIWWRQFRLRMPQLKLDTVYERTDSGTIVRGYAFSGFELTIPRSNPPPKGTPKLLQWTLLVKRDGTVDEQPSKTVYSRR